MVISKKMSLQLLVGTSVMLVVPMIIFYCSIKFPQQFGTELVKPALVNALYELVFYAAVLYLFNRRASLIQLSQAAGLCLVYRMGVGLLLGVAMSLSYSMSLSVSIQLAISSYLPAILFHIALTPLVMRSAVMPIFETKSNRSDRVPNRSLSSSEPTGTTSVAISRTQGVVMTPAETAGPIKPNREPISRQMSPTPGPHEDTNGFDRAVRYVGEHGSVYMAAVVDHEGLLYAQYHRGKFVPEDYAPLAQLLVQDNLRSLNHRGFDFSELERIDLGLKNERLVVYKHPFCTLVVIAEKQSDDLLNIRINQGMDIITRYVEEKYPTTKPSNVENKYVPST